MSISRQNLTVVIVSFMSEHVIESCIDSIPSDIEIIVVDNSGDLVFKKKIEEKYKNVKCILSKTNTGMGSGNNLGLKNINTDFGFVLNPDVVLEKNTIDELIHAANEINNFAILAPLINSNQNLNYKLFKNSRIQKQDNNPFIVKSVDGFAMLLNLKKIKNLKNFTNNNFFDENIFLYLENDDLCKRLIDDNQNIYIVPKSKINHLGASAVNKKYKKEVELLRNWHWIWSKFYFNKKHNGYLIAIIDGLPIFLSAIFKFLLYFLINDKNKRQIYFHRSNGYISALIGRKSYLRPKIKH